jgi:hypothetical protein
VSICEIYLAMEDIPTFLLKKICCLRYWRRGCCACIYGPYRGKACTRLLDSIFDVSPVRKQRFAHLGVFCNLATISIIIWLQKEGREISHKNEKFPLNITNAKGSLHAGSFNKNRNI